MKNWKKILRKKLSDDAVNVITASKEDFSEWLDRITWTNKKCDKLAREVEKYRGLEEQGLLLRLPCKVGDTVYKIDIEAKKPIIAMIVNEIRFKALRSGKVITKILCSDDVMVKTNGCIIYYEEEIGKKVFLTQSEGEEKLRELEETL